jgi:hypothetical protein
MRKYGIDNFIVESIETVISNINEREIFWINNLKPEYNMTKGGDGGNTSSSPNYKQSMKKYHSNKIGYATYGMLGKQQSDKFFTSIKKSNSCPVSCNGIEYASVGEAQEAYPGISVRKRLDNSNYPEFYRLRPRTLRRNQNEPGAAVAGRSE